MDDPEIIALYEARDERAVSETQAQYGSRCRRFAQRILGSSEDAEECVNDALLKVWETIPPQHPESLAAYLTVLTRNIALNRLKAEHRQMRGGGQIPAVLDELAACIPAADTVESVLDRHSFVAALERFLDTLSHDARVIFVRRYWYMNSCREIADAYSMSESKVRVSLTRTRKKLKVFLIKEDAI